MHMQCQVQLAGPDKPAEDQGPREVYDYRGNKTLDLGGGAFSARSIAAEGPSHALTWGALKAVRVQLLLLYQERPCARIISHVLPPQMRTLRSRNLLVMVSGYVH